MTISTASFACGTMYVPVVIDASYTFNRPHSYKIALWRGKCDGRDYSSFFYQTGHQWVRGMTVLHDIIYMIHECETITLIIQMYDYNYC